MKARFIQKAAILLLGMAAFVVYTSCVDSNKNYYDPDLREPNPMGEDVVAPDGFDWATSATIQLTVDVADSFNGQYFYVVEVFDGNPYIEQANLLKKGVAKKGQSFVTELTVSHAIPTIYIRQTAPNGLSETRSFSTDTSVIRCDFNATGTKAVSAKMASTRAFIAMDAPDHNDKTLFPDVAPVDATVWGQSQEYGKSYKVTSATTEINCWTGNVNLYVTENATLSSLYLTGGCKLYILPGVTLTFNGDCANNGQYNCLISTGKNATLKVNGLLKVDNNYKLFNLGTLQVNNLTCTNTSFFYNGATTQVAETLDGTNYGTNMLNGADGTLISKNILLSGGSHFINYGIVNTQDTKLDATNGSWENSGEWTSGSMEVKGWNEFALNRCKLLVKEVLDLNETILTIDGGAQVKCQKLLMNNTRIDLGSKSLFEVTELATYKYQTPDRGFKGTGAEKALLKIKKAVASAGVENNSNLIHYAGNLMVVCDDHPAAEIDPSNIRWTLTAGAAWSNEAENPVQIDKTACNEGTSITPGPIVEPTFPIEVASSDYYTMLFEDQWPYYGDYDMNDAVFGISDLTYEMNSNNKVKKVSFTVTIKAVGAAKFYAGAVMLDKVLASNVQTIAYTSNNKKPSTFFRTNTAGVEEGQTNAVIPLFDDIHALFNLADSNPFVNTIVGSPNNTTNLPVIEVTVHLKDEMEESNFNINHINFFIVIDKFSPRREVHLAGYRPTDLINTAYYGNNDDATSIAHGKYFISKENLAWTIMVPGAIKWPQEYKNIQLAYPDFKAWVTSGGTQKKTWWTNINEEYIFP